MIGFWKIEDKFGEFSNWYHAEFDYSGHHFVNSEQAFMFMKAELFEDKEMMEKILKTNSPSEVKSFGRLVKNFSSIIFDEHKYYFMVTAVYEKFRQNERLKDLLLSTGEVLVEASPLDKIWGIGLSIQDVDFRNPSKWKGSNLLGKALMEVRKRLREESK